MAHCLGKDLQYLTTLQRGACRIFLGQPMYINDSEYNGLFMIRSCIILWFVYSLISCGVSKHQAPYKFQHDASLSTSTTEPSNYQGLKQVVAFQENLFSGSRPESELGIRELKSLNVATIICVDGISSEVEAARRHGIETIHIPLKYNAPNESQILDLCSAFIMNRSLGNVYIHCHHGKHRSATAAALVSIALGLSNVQEMKDRMHVSGTSQHYTGLWEAVEKQQLISIPEVDKNKKKFPSMVKPIGMTAQMIEIDNALDRILLVKQSQWTVPDSHPDLAPAADAGLIAEIFRSMKFETEPAFTNKKFLSHTINALHKASRLEQNLNRGTVDIGLLDQCFRQLEQSCIQCHTKWRK